jgi:transposase
VWFAYSPDRKGEHPKQHLKSFKGALQADAYAGFHHLYEGGAIYEAACWAHARRKFHEIHIAHPSPITSEAIERIAIRHREGDTRQHVRGPQVDPSVQSNASARQPACMDGVQPQQALPQVRHGGGDPLRALAPARPDAFCGRRRSRDRQQHRERALRVVALGRKNLSFRRFRLRRERAAALYSLLGTASLNALDPEFYLRHVLARIADHPIKRIHDLLPWNASLTPIHTSHP